MEEFAKNKPAYATVHFDGKLIQDLTGTLKENLAILVSGAPHNLKGNILSGSKLMDEDGKPTSTGEAQALAVQVEITAWGLENAILVVVFDTLAVTLLSMTSLSSRSCLATGVMTPSLQMRLWL